MANTGGGSIYFGVDDDGKPNGVDLSGCDALDAAVIVDKLQKYTTAVPPAIMKKRLCEGRVFAIEVGPALSPIVFDKDGTYVDSRGKNQCAFHKGTIYVRHSAKSEPASSADLREIIDRRFDDWRAKIRQVVEAPSDAAIHVSTIGADAERTIVRISDNPAAPEFRLDEHGIRDLYPYNYKSLSREIKRRMPSMLENQEYHRIRRQLEGNRTYCFVRYMDPRNPRSGSTKWYSERMVEAIVNALQQTTEGQVKGA